MISVAARTYIKALAYNSDRQLEYEGWALPGASKALPLWTIKEITYNSDKQVSDEKWASKGADNLVWNSRTTYVFS